MIFIEGLEKIKLQIPDNFYIIGDDDKTPDFEIRIKLDGTPLGEAYFCLHDKNSINRMNIKYNTSAEILEAYPLSDKESFTLFKIDKEKIESSCHPYLSISSKENLATHFYYIDKETKKLLRKDLNGNWLEYSYYEENNIKPEVLQKVWDMYTPDYAFTYHQLNEKNNPYSFNFGYCPLNKNYYIMRDKLFH